MTDRFELMSQLGKGGMGIVWKARDRESGEVVALKLVHSLYADDPDYIARFEREVEVARRIDSLYVVRVLGYGRQDGVPYMAMEYVEGPSLRELLKEKGKLPWDDEAPPFSRPAPGAKRLIRQIAEGLAAAHATGVIHRDIKPSNILIAADGTAKLADFGIARAMDMTRLTGSSTMLGTPAYMSPDGDSTAQSDLYALGVVAYEMLAGTPPFVGDSQQQVLLKHLREPPDLEKLPTGARDVTGWLLEKEPRRRPLSAAALLEVLDGSSHTSRRHIAAEGSSRLRPVLLIGGPTTLGIALVAAVALLMWGSGNSDSKAIGAREPPASANTTEIRASAITSPAPASTSILAPVDAGAPAPARTNTTSTTAPATATRVPTTAIASPTTTPLPSAATPLSPTATPTPDYSAARGTIRSVSVTQGQAGATVTVTYDYSGPDPAQFYTSLEDPTWPIGSNNRSVGSFSFTATGQGTRTVSGSVPCAAVLAQFRNSSQKDAAVVRVAFTYLSLRLGSSFMSQADQRFPFPEVQVSCTRPT